MPIRLIEDITEPHPIGRRIPLSVKEPELATEWDFERNRPWGPEDFSYGSNVSVWWQCPEDKQRHRWRATISNRTTTHQSGCPFCYFDSYGLNLRQFPQVFKLFDKEKNSCSPYKIPIGTKIYWDCRKGKNHQWHSRFNIEVVDAFCPFCRGRKAGPDSNLAALFPEIAKQFHPTKNGAIKVKNLVPGSKLKIWWRCDKGKDHEWQTRPRDRTVDGEGCPYCSRQRFSPTHSLAAEYPAIAKQWHETFNGDFSPKEISSRSKRVVWWKCPKGEDHEWAASINRRTNQETGCPYCVSREVSTTNSLAELFPEVAAEFDLKKNHPTKPTDVVVGSAKVYWWVCKRKHSWQREVYLRTKRGTGCPECPEYKKRSMTNPLSNYPEITKHLHPKKNGAFNPKEISAGSKQKVWWLCKKGPDHVWESWIDVTMRKGYKCPFCEGSRLSVTNNIKRLYPHLAKEWLSEKNDKKVEHVLPGSAYKPWWQCSKCKHQWQRECYLRTQRQSACPQCKAYPS